MLNIISVPTPKFISPNFYEYQPYISTAPYLDRHYSMLQGYGLPRQFSANDCTWQWYKNSPFLINWPVQDCSMSRLCTRSPCGAGWDFLRAVLQAGETFYRRQPKLEPVSQIPITSSFSKEDLIGPFPWLPQRLQPWAERYKYQRSGSFSEVWVSVVVGSASKFEVLIIHPLSSCSTSPRGDITSFICYFHNLEFSFNL